MHTKGVYLPSAQSLGTSRLRGQQEVTLCASFFTVALRQTGSCIYLRAACHSAAIHSFSHVIALSCVSAVLSPKVCPEGQI